MQKTFEDVFSNTSLSIGILRKNSLFRKWESEFLLNQFWEGDFQCLGNPILLPLVSREWKNGSNSSYNCTPFRHSLLTKGKLNPKSRQHPLSAT